MRHVYIAAYRVLGVNYPETRDVFVVGSFPETNGEASIVPTINEHLFEIDRASAIGTSILKVVFQGNRETIDEQIATEIEAIRSSRASNPESSVYLLYKGEGPVDHWNPTNVVEKDEFEIAFQATDKSVIRQLHQRSVQGAIAAISLKGEHIHGVNKVADGIYFLDDAGKTHYSLTFGGSANLTVSTTLKHEVVDYVKTHSPLLSNHPELVDPSRLLAKSLDEESDVLLGFLSVWAALEIFVNKTFNHYEAAALGDPAKLDVPGPILRRIRDVMSDKFRLADKFALVSGSLDPDRLDGDLEELMGLKKVRDKLMHGSDVSIQDLPVQRTRNLLRKYLTLHIDRIANLTKQ